MATWPSGSKASTTNLDAGTDSPRLARPDIKQNVDNVNAIVDMFNIDSPTADQILKYNTSNARFELAADATGTAVSATTFVGDDSTGTAVNAGETFKIAGGTNITTAVSGDTLTITGPNLTTYATETYVGTQIANLVDSSPSALDTLNELAAALGDDENFATTVTNSLSGKLEKGDLTVSGSAISSSGDIIDLNDIVRFNVGYKEDISTLTSSASIAVDASTSSVHTVTLAENTTFSIENIVTGQSMMIIITQDGTGSRTGAFTSVKFPGGTPTLSTAAGAIDVISIFSDGTNYLGNIAKAFA